MKQVSKGFPIDSPHTRKTIKRNFNASCLDVVSTNKLIIKRKTVAHDRGDIYDRKEYFMTCSSKFNYYANPLRHAHYSSKHLISFCIGCLEYLNLSSIASNFSHHFRVCLFRVQSIES